MKLNIGHRQDSTGGLLFGWRHSEGTAKGVASISPLRGLGVIGSVLARSVLRLAWCQPATEMVQGARGDLRP